MSAEEAAKGDAAAGRLVVALYQPDIAGNTGTILRTAACLDAAVAVIDPAGFDLSDRALRRAGMDYLDIAALVRHSNWQAFDAWRCAAGRRLVLFTTKAEESYTEIAYQADDVLLFGRESAGVPEKIHAEVDVRVTIPMQRKARSLNLAVAVGMGLGEALRQASRAIAETRKT